MTRFDLRTGLEIEVVLPEGATRLDLAAALSSRLDAGWEAVPFFSKVPVPALPDARMVVALIEDIARHHDAVVHAVSPDLRFFYLRHRAARLVRAGVELLRVVHDNTLAGGERVAEIVTAPLVRSELDLVTDVLAVARDLGADTPPTAALHVHLDGAAFRDARSLSSLVAAYLDAEDALRAFVRTPTALRRARAFPVELARDLAALPRATPWPEIAQLILRHVSGRDHALNLYNLAVDAPGKRTVELKLAASTVDGERAIAIRERYVELAARALHADARRAADVERIASRRWQGTMDGPLNA